MAQANLQHSVNVLAAQFASTLQRSIKDQRAYVETLGEQTVRNGDVHGFIDLGSEGEIVAVVKFPLSFLEKPLFAPGLELADNTWLGYGSFPIWSATVGAWNTDLAGESILYTGAVLGIVVIGAPRSILHYSFRARSFTAPTGTERTVGSPL